MTSDEVVALFRADVGDSESPYVFSDVEAYQFLDQAQKTFCRMTGGIADSSTAAVTQVSYTANNAWASIDPRVLRINRVHRASDYVEVGILNHENLGSLSDTSDYGFSRPIRLTNQTGAVRYVVTNMEQDKVRLIDVPAANGTLQLSVYRLPILTINAKAQALEIQEHHHPYLVYWMKFLAFGKLDPTAERVRAAEAAKLRFMDYCEQSRQERERREHKVREVAYGGL